MTIPESQNETPIETKQTKPRQNNTPYFQVRK